MSKASKAFLRELHTLINYDVSIAMEAITGSKLIEHSDSVGLVGLSEKEIRALGNIHLTPEQVLALKKALIATGRGIVFGLLCIIDGVAYTESEDIPDLALVNRATGENLSDQFLHDEFYEVAPE